MAADPLSRLRVRANHAPELHKRDPADDLGWEKEQAKADLAEVIEDLDALQMQLWAEGTRSLLVVIQAMDAGGKDGLIRSVFGPLNAAGVHVTSFKAPVGAELGHDYLWRVHAAAPVAGEIGVWNRSHYEDVLVVRVRELFAEQRWRKRYRHIREFERLLADEGTRIVKLHLQISKDEQRQRLQERIDDPLKRWKFRAGDLDDRALWGDYMAAYEEAIAETSTAAAPWWVIPSDRKWVRNLAVARIIRATLRDMDPQLPPEDPSIVGTTVV